MGGRRPRPARKLGAASGGRGSSAGSTPLTASQDCSATRPRKTRRLCGRCCWAAAAAAGRGDPRERILRRANPKQEPLVHRTRTAETNRGIQGPLPLWADPILGVSKTPRWARAANIWTQCYSNYRPRCIGGLTPSTCLIVTIGASTGSGSAAPPRVSAEVPAGVWIGWASPCRGPPMAMEALPAPLGAVAKPGGCVGGALLGHWKEPGAVILGHLLSDE